MAVLEVGAGEWSAPVGQRGGGPAQGLLGQQQLDHQQPPHLGAHHAGGETPGPTTRDWALGNDRVHVFIETHITTGHSAVGCQGLTHHCNYN